MVRIFGSVVFRIQILFVIWTFYWWNVIISVYLSNFKHYFAFIFGFLICGNGRRSVAHLLFIFILLIYIIFYYFDLRTLIIEIVFFKLFILICKTSLIFIWFIIVIIWLAGRTIIWLCRVIKFSLTIIFWC